MKILVVLGVLALLVAAAINVVGILGKVVFCVSLIALFLIAHIGTELPALDEDKWDLFWRQFVSPTSMLILVFCWAGWLRMHTMVVAAVVIVNAVLAVSLATEVAEVHPPIRHRAFATGWMFMCIGVAVFYAVSNTQSVMDQLERNISGRWFPWLMVFVVALLGGLAHFFKGYSQEMYGVTEVLFGLSAIHRAALTWSKATKPAVEWVAIIGFAYIVARGLNNYREATASKV